MLPNPQDSTGLTLSPASISATRRSIRSTASSAVGRRSVAASKIVRVSSIEDPVRHLQDLRADEAGGHAGAGAPSGEHRSATFDQLALLYAMGLTLFGFVFPLSNYVSVKPFSPWYLAAFYIALHLVSIAFLVFFLGWILRRPGHILFLPNEQQQQQQQQQQHQHGIMREPIVFHIGTRDSVASIELPHESPSAAAAAAPAGAARILELLDPGAAADCADSADSVSVASSSSTDRSSVFGTRASAHSEATTNATAIARRRRRGGLGVRVNSTLLQNARELGVQEIPAYSVLSLQESHSPSFFLRVACFIFGSLKVTHEGLMIVDTLTDVTGGCAGSQSESAGLVIQYALSISFTVLQTFFIFKYSKVSVNCYRKLSVIGFMHLVATNMCIWFQAILLETSHSSYTPAVKTTGNGSQSSNSSYATTTATTVGPSDGSSCSKDVFWRMAPYLFPFTIEYALMAAFSSFSLYRNVSKFLDVIQTKGFNVAKKCLRNRKRAQTSFSASCYKTDKGFFLGALLLIIGLVSGIYFTVYVNDKPNDGVTSQLIYQVTDLVLLAANLLLCIVAYYKLSQLTMLHRAVTGPDSWLLGITLIGVLAFQLFQLFGSTVEVGAFLGLRVAQGLLAISQSVFQVFLVLDGEKRRSKTEAAIEEKPGREAIAAVLLGNISLWIVYTLEIREVNNLPNYSQAYVSVASNIFTYVCSPLIIFFRFHSACCFVEIWRTAYKTKKSRCHGHSDATHASCSTSQLPDSINGLAEVCEKSHL